MFYILSSAFFLFSGFLCGVLVMRRHASKLTDAQAKGKALLDALKGK